jgi:VirE N-terminal domain
MSNWLDRQVSLYKTHGDNNGRVTTFREVLLTDFSKDLQTIISLRALDKFAENYDTEKLSLKSKLQCYTPAALLACKAKGKLQEISRTGIMQLDFDYKDISDYDIEELKQAIFYGLPSVVFCGLSCSGDGFYALVAIAEPERLTEYAEHCFEYFKKYGVNPDESKGKKIENLRYLSYDCNMLIRENPEALKIKRFIKKPTPNKAVFLPSPYQPTANGNGLLNKAIKDIQQTQKGQRWATVQTVAFTIGGLNDPQYLQDLINAINNNTAFAGQEEKYIKCAKDCFHAGSLKPLTTK